jgi:molybdopterin-guanine dinucleotide biosynthesis protein A
MGGVDKGLIALQQRPLAQWVIDRLRPQVGPLLISANRNAEDWQRFGYPVIADRIAGFAGPLAGVQAGLAACATPWLLTAPCDSPFLPGDLVARLGAAALATHADLAVVRSEQRLQPVFALMRREVLPSLDEFLAGGDRKTEIWFDRLKIAVVDFDDEAAFANINTPDDLAAARPMA